MLAWAGSRLGNGHSEPALRISWASFQTLLLSIANTERWSICARAQQGEAPIKDQSKPELPLLMTQLTRHMKGPKKTLQLSSVLTDCLERPHKSSCCFKIDICSCCTHPRFRDGELSALPGPHLAIVKEKVVRHTHGAVRGNDRQADADGGEQDGAHTAAPSASSHQQLR